MRASQADQSIHKGELLLQQVTAQGLDLGPKYHRQPGEQHRHVDLKQHDPHRHHGVELVVEHQLPEGPGAGQVEDEDKQPQHHAHRRQDGGRLDDAALAAGPFVAQQHREAGGPAEMPSRNR